MDNFFSGDKTCDWIGSNGFGYTMSCLCDQLSSGAPAKYWHKEKTGHSHKVKVARFFLHVGAVKTVPAKNGMSEYTKVHVSFQSTSLCILSTVNVLNEYTLTVYKRTWGYNKNKHMWGIEMNIACQLYLGTYSRIDSIDHLVENCHMK